MDDRAGVAAARAKPLVLSRTLPSRSTSSARGKGATLIGNGPDTLTKITVVGDDAALDAGIGTCGKHGQGVPVGVGQPTLKLAALTVGGAAA